jgi:hypothetical protein
MDKERLKKLAERPEFIPGIYNYCDRWCERCPFTARCLNYAMGQEDVPAPQGRAPGQAPLWDQMKETFDATLELLQDLADKAGIDLDTMLAPDEAHVHTRRDAEVHDHRLAHASRMYAARVDGWFTQARRLFAQHRRVHAAQAELGLPDEDPESSALQDALDVVQWYRNQIHVKLMRALRGVLDEPPDLPAGFPRDADGSAKVALIGMDRSIAAWCAVWLRFPDQEDEILPLLVHLERMRRETERLFPRARAFVRPGFDEAGG